MGKGTASTGGFETVGTHSIDDYIEGSPQTFKSAHVAPLGTPARWIKIATQETNLRDYPYDGDGLLDGVTDTSHIQIDNASSGMPATGECLGMLIQMIAGTALNIGEVRRITAHAANHQLTLNSALPATPSIGDQYELYIDIFRMSELLIKTEYSASNTAADLIVALYDYSRTFAGVARKSIKTYDTIISPDNQAIQGRTEESSYYHGRLLATEVRSMLGAKVRLNAISNGNASLWACGA